MISSAHRIVAIAVALGAGIGTAAAQPYFITDFDLHDFDAEIIGALGFDSTANVTYFRELASITPEQLSEQRKYEAVSCSPFYVMRAGKSEDKGYNCRSFFCVGYMKSPKQCQDFRGSAYGGVVEINKRLSITYVQDTRKKFAAFPASEQTSSMQTKIAELSPLKCSPLFLMRFDVAVGEGYECEEVGKYPFYSSQHVCTDDWRDTKSVACEPAIRTDEMDIRRDALDLPKSSSSASSASGGSLSSLSSASSAMSVPSFPDVLQGQYGYTAIMDLAMRGIVKGYPDGTFKPKKTVNRAEFVKLLLEGLHAGEIRGETQCFPDVLDQWFASVVCAARRLGWVRGYTDGKFRASQTITRAEAIKIIVSSLRQPLASSVALPLGVPDDQWYSPYIRKAVELKIILEPSFHATTEATRADAAVWIYRASKVQSGLPQ